MGVLKKWNGYQCAVFETTNFLTPVRSFEPYRKRIEVNFFSQILTVSKTYRRIFLLNHSQSTMTTATKRQKKKQKKFYANSRRNWISFITASSSFMTIPLSLVNSLVHLALIVIYETYHRIPLSASNLMAEYLWHKQCGRVGFVTVITQCRCQWLFSLIQKTCVTNALLKSLTIIW